MNSKQKLVISVGVILVVLSGLFPPYVGELTLDHDIYKVYMGYYPLFTPPPTPEIQKAFALPSYLDNAINRGRIPIPFWADIAVSRITVQLATIVLATVGLVLLLRGKKKSGKDEPSSGL